MPSRGYHKLWHLRQRIFAMVAGSIWSSSEGWLQGNVYSHKSTCQRRSWKCPFVCRGNQEKPQRKCIIILCNSIYKLDPALLKLTQAVAELDGENLPLPVAEIPWGHNILLLGKLRSPSKRLWYAIKTKELGWSRSVLVHQIESDLYEEISIVSLMISCLN